MSGEGALAVFARARDLERQGRSIIHLELGEPDFHPAAPVVEAGCGAIRAGRDRYVTSRGLPALRDAIAEYLGRTRRLRISADQVLITPGCKPALSLAMMALIEPGDEVLVPDPGFPTYASMTRGLGAVPVPFRLLERNRLQPDPDEIASLVTRRTRVLLFNSPGNPTGTVYDSAALQRIAGIAVEHDLTLISDEIYARIVFSGAYESISLMPGMAGRTVIVDGFSKSFAMTGWRLGFAVAPPALIDALDLLVINMFTSVAEFTQLAAIEALRDRTHAVDAMVEEYRRRRDLFVGGLNRIPGFRCALPEGAFYAWVNVGDTGLRADELCRLLLEEAGVAAIPGAAFGASGEDFVRFSLVSASPLLEEALARMQALASRWHTR